jgi:hypothetical protein
MAISKGEFTYFVDEDKITRTFEGEIYKNNTNKVEIYSDINLLHEINSNKNGFLVKPFLKKSDFFKLQELVFEFLTKSFKKNLNRDNITEKLLNIDDSEFKEKMRKLYYGIPFEELNFKKIDVEKWASKIIGLDLHCDDLPSKSDGGYVGPPGPKSIQIRIVRPNKSDFNPPHRDIYYDNLRNALNCFMPIFGVNEKSSLPILKGSHLWKENKTIRTDKYPIIDGHKFSVPAVTSNKDGSFLKLIRPKVKYGQVMLFSPYAIHGGGVNLGKEVRISFEFRFWKK